jgi:hypothetical protein
VIVGASSRTQMTTNFLLIFSFSTSQRRYTSSPAGTFAEPCSDCVLVVRILVIDDDTDRQMWLVRAQTSTTNLLAIFTFLTIYYCQCTFGNISFSDALSLLELDTVFSLEHLIASSVRPQL